MKFSKIVSLSMTFAIVALSACTKQPPIQPCTNCGPGPSPSPSPKAPQVKCYDATPTSLSKKHAAMLCSSSQVGVKTVTECYDNTPTAITNGQASLTCSGSPDRKPVDCINSPDISALDNFNAAVLCSNSGDNTAIHCFKNTPQSLFDNEASVMCQRANTWDGPNNCYANTPVSLPEPSAATLCSQTIGNGNRSLECYAQTPLSLSDADAAILCQKTNDATATLTCWKNAPSYLSNHDAAVLCSGAYSSATANDCMAGTSTALSNSEAAILCSGTTSNSRKAISCYNGTSVNLSEADSAILCTGNNGLLTSMYSVNTQYNNRITSRGQGNRGQSLDGLLAAFGSIDSSLELGPKKSTGSVRGQASASEERLAAEATYSTRKLKNIGTALADSNEQNPLFRGVSASARMRQAQDRISHIRNATVKLDDVRSKHPETHNSTGARRGEASGSHSGQGRGHNNDIKEMYPDRF